MKKNYSVFRDGLLWTKTLTNIKAQRIAQELRDKGFKAEVVPL